MSEPDASRRRIQLTLRKPRFALYGGVKPTLVIDGRGQPAQWGTGTWQIPTGGTVMIGVYLFNRIWRFGAAASDVETRHRSLTYHAPVLPFLRGHITLIDHH